MNNKFTIEAVLKASGADQFSKDFQNATKSMDGIGRASKKSAGGLKSFMGGVGKIAGAIGVTKLVSAGFNAIRSSVDGAVSRVDTLNQFPKVLQQMGASGEDADRSIARLSDGIQGLPTTLDGVASTAQRMFTILGDIDLATESTLALNNAFLASGASQADASRGLEQYTQMLSAGKVDMQSWRTLQETMPYALKETAEAFGFTGQAATNDFYDALQSGEITMAEMNEKIIELSNETGGFAETALEASKGLATSWQNIKTAIVTGTANIIQAINEWMEDSGLGGIADNFDKVKVAVQGAFRYIVENIPTVLNKIKDLFDTVKNSIAFQTLKEVIGDVITIGQELIQQILESEVWASFKDLVKDIAQAILDIDFGEVIQQTRSLIDALTPLAVGILGAVVAFKALTIIKTVTSFIKGYNMAMSAGVGIQKAFTVAMTTTKGLQGYGTALKATAAVKGALAAITAKLSAAIAFLTSPIFLAAAAIGALIVIGVLLYKNWDTIKEKAQQLGDKISEVWENIKTWTSETWDGIKEYLSNLWTGIVESANDFFTPIGEFFTELWNDVTDVFQSAWDGILNLLEVAWLLVVELFNLYIDIIMIPWNFLWENFSEPLTEAWEAIKTYLSETLETISLWITEKWTAIKDFTSETWMAIKQAIIVPIQEAWADMQAKIQEMWQGITEKWNAIKAVTTTIWNAIKTVLMTVWNAIKTIVSTAVTAVSTKVSSVWNTIKSVTSTIWEGIKSTISRVWEGIKTGVSTATEAVKTSVSSAWDSIKTKTSEVWSSLKEAITTPINSAKDTVKGAIDKMKGFMDFSWSLPKLKMPRFSKSGKFSLNPPSVPKFGVEWYKDGGIMSSATAFGMNGNNVMVGGEAGKEAILPLNRSVLGDIGRGIVDSTNMGSPKNITINQYITSPNALNEREMQRRSRLELQKLGVDFAY